jgi:CheY-like chemotaxis protein
MKTEAVPPKRQQIRDLSGTGTVLVVDDEEVVRRVARETLERHGYTVLLAEDGAAGVEMFRREARQITCAVLDLTMPVMSGEEALARIKDLRSDVPVILTSGFNELEAVRRFEGKGLAGFLQKPYRAEGLLEKVKSVMRFSWKSHPWRWEVG